MAQPVWIKIIFCQKNLSTGVELPGCAKQVTTFDSPNACAQNVSNLAHKICSIRVDMLE